LVAIGLVVLGALLWRRRLRRLAAAAPAPAGSSAQGKTESDCEKGKVGNGTADASLHSRQASATNLDLLASQSMVLPALAPPAPAPAGQAASVRGMMSRAASGELNSHFLRTRFGAIDGMQLGDLLGQGDFGRVRPGAKM
jgi:hypothetical protein